MSMNPATIRAAGGVVWRRADSGPDSGIEVVLVHRPRYDDWSLPKGKLQSGESEVKGAVREVLEEAGYDVLVGPCLGETRYQKVTGKGVRPKVVRWWAMEAISGTFTPTREVDKIHWASLAEAHSLLTRDTDRELLGRFSARLGPAEQGAVLEAARLGPRG